MEISDRRSFAPEFVGCIEHWRRSTRSTCWRWRYLHFTRSIIRQGIAGGRCRSSASISCSFRASSRRSAAPGSRFLFQHTFGTDSRRRNECRAGTCTSSCLGRHRGASATASQAWPARRSNQPSGAAAEPELCFGGARSQSAPGREPGSYILASATGARQIFDCSCSAVVDRHSFFKGCRRIQPERKQPSEAEQKRAA